MVNFEEETAKKIKQQLENGELNNLEEQVETNTEDQKVVDNCTVQDLENSKEFEKESKKSDGESVQNIEDKIEESLNKETENYHYNRKDKVRPLSLIATLLSLIVSLGIIAVGVYAVILIVKPLIGVMSSVAGTFFKSTTLAVSIGFSGVFGVILIILLAIPIIAVGALVLSLCTTTIQISINGFKTMNQPIQVFAFDNKSSKNVIFSYILGAVISFLGIAMNMDGGIKLYIWLPTLIVGIVFLLVSTLYLIDLIVGKKVWRNLEDEQEKQGIKQEASNRNRKEMLKRKNRKRVEKLFGWIIKK